MAVLAASAALLAGCGDGTDLRQMRIACETSGGIVVVTDSTSGFFTNRYSCIGPVKYIDLPGYTNN